MTTQKDVAEKRAKKYIRFFLYCQRWEFRKAVHKGKVKNITLSREFAELLKSELRDRTKDFMDSLPPREGPTAYKISKMDLIRLISDGVLLLKTQKMVAFFLSVTNQGFTNYDSDLSRNGQYWSKVALEQIRASMESVGRQIYIEISRFHKGLPTMEEIYTSWQTRF